MSSVTQGGLVPPDQPAHKRSGLVEFIREASVPLVVTLGFLAVIIVVLLLTGSISSLPGVITALAGLITAVAGLVTALRFGKGREAGPDQS